MTYHKTLYILVALISSCSVVCLSSRTVTAQEAPENVIELAPIYLYARGYTSEESSAASRTATLVREIPLTVSTTTRARMDDELLFDDMDAISRSTGMNVSGYPYESDISSRGFATLSNLNGLRMTSEDSNFTPVIDTYLLDGIEILRGPAGLLEGAGEPGGMVSRSLKHPPLQFENEAGLAFGSDNFRRAELETGGPLSQNVRVGVSAVFQDRDFHYDVADHRRVAILGAIEADLTPDTVFRLSGVHQRDDRTPFWGLPSHEDGYLLDLDHSTFLGSRQGRFDSEFNAMSAELAHGLANGWTAKVMASSFSQKIDEFDLIPIGPAYRDGNRTLVDLGLNVNRDEERGHNFDLSIGGPFEIFGRTHKAVIGASMISSNLKVDERWGYDGFPVDVDDPDISLPISEAADDGIQQDRNYRQYGLYGQVNYKLSEPLTLTAGGRVSWAKMTSDITGPVLQDYEENGFFTPVVGLVYDLNPLTAIYGSYADIYEVNFHRDADLQPLPPMTGTQYEIGIKSELSSGLMASAAVFDITRKNQAHRVGLWPSQVYRADGETRSRGAELEVSGRISPAWKIFVGYAYTDHKVTRSRDGGRIGKTASNTPRHNLSLWLAHEVQSGALQGLEIGTGVNARSKIFDYDNSLRAPGHVTVDMAFNYAVRDDVRATLKVENLFNESYYKSLGTSGMHHFYGEPRRVVFQIRKRM